MSEEIQADCIYKILLLGDSVVGKTCILMRFTEGTFPEIHMSTVGLDYRLKLMNLEDGKQAKVCIWDTAGQERFRAITKNYYKGAQGIMLIYDITNSESFANVRNWLQQIKENASDKATIFLIGNKCDDDDNRQITFEEGQKVGNDYKIQFFETSAKQDLNISSTFEALVKEIFKKLGSSGEHKNSIKGVTKEEKKKCCS